MLSDPAKQLLDLCAQAIAAGVSRKVDLFRLNGERTLWADAPAYLASRVEGLSYGQLTVRRADHALFAVTGGSGFLCLAVCPVGTPEGTVVEFRDGMVPVRIGPYDDGFTMPALLMTSDGVAAKRTADAMKETVLREEPQDKADANDFLLRVYSELNQRIEACTDDGLRAELQWVYDRTAVRPNLESAANMCRRLGTNLIDLCKDMQA